MAKAGRPSKVTRKKDYTPPKGVAIISYFVSVPFVEDSYRRIYERFRGTFPDGSERHGTVICKETAMREIHTRGLKMIINNEYGTVWE